MYSTGRIYASPKLLFRLQYLAWLALARHRADKMMTMMMKNITTIHVAIRTAMCPICHWSVLVYYLFRVLFLRQQRHRQLAKLAAFTSQHLVIPHNI
jgi:RNase P subunit RPR2